MGKGYNGKTLGYRMFLSEKDEYVPDDFISITEIFSNPKYTLPGYSADDWCLGENRLKEMRTKTFYAIRDRFYKAGSTKYDRYWNSNLDAINYLGLNEFHKLGCFVELAQVMICFETSIETKYMKGSKRKYISWGIRKKNYNLYCEHLQKALENNVEPDKINLHDVKKSSRGKLAAVNLPSTKVIFDWVDGTQKTMKLEQNEIYSTFCQWCKLKSIEKKRALYSAMMLLMQSNPVKELQNAEIKKAKTDIEIVHEIAMQEKNVGARTFTLSIPEELNKQMDNVVNRFNNDVENLGKPKLYKKDLIVQAIQFYVKYLPLKYTNPFLLEEYESIKRDEIYNQKIMNKKE